MHVMERRIVNIIKHMLRNMWTLGKSLVVAMATWFSRHRFIKENINIDCLGKSPTHEAITRTAVLGRDY